MAQLLCPLDHLSLVQDGRTLRCAQGHCYDLAKQGYVNLLPVQNKRSRDPGDSKEMVRARHEFLQQGWYAGLCQWMVDELAAALADVPAPVILDAGCGEGYYTQALCQRLRAAGQEPECYGLDISKWALMVAGRRDTAIHWVVGSNRSLPLPDASVDLLLCAFGFYSLEEFARVLRPGGRLALIDPAENHLLALRQLIYPEVRRSGPPPLKSREASGFCAEVTESAYQGQTGAMTPEAIAQLLCMTPHLYRAPAEGVARAQAAATLDCEIDVRLRWLQRRPL